MGFDFCRLRIDEISGFGYDTLVRFEHGYRSDNLVFNSVPILFDVLRMPR
jgi:hypothetical protein